MIDLSWVAIPNRHDGENFSAIMAHKDGAIIYAAWILLLQVASRCHPRGRLVRDNKTPHNCATLSLKTRAPSVWFKVALEYLERNTDWLEVEQDTIERQEAVTAPPSSCQAGDEEGKGIEQNGIYSPNTQKKPEVLTNARVIVHYLNERTGRKFREQATNLTLIRCRLEESGITVEGVKQMIDRQCKRWMGDAKMEEYLRPKTLFGKENFESYYAAKDLPVAKEQVNSKPKQKPFGQGEYKPFVPGTGNL